MKNVFKSAIVALTFAATLTACQNNQPEAASVSSAAPTVAETPVTDTNKMSVATTPAPTPAPQSATTTAENGKMAPTTVKATATTPVAGKPVPVTPINAAAPTQPVTPSPTPASNGKSTSIKWENMTYDWGSVKEGDKVTQVFKFKNTGTEPLVILDAKASCGCTVPEKPQAPIAPGKTGELKVVFDSSHKAGPQTKTVTVTANTEPANMVLTIKGEVKAKE